jgi:steroid delta-isomerase-like uncharacterized protein
MRNVSLAVAIGLVLVACGGADAEPPKTPTPPVATTTTPPPAPTAEAPKEEAKKESPMELQKKTMQAFGDAMASRDSKKLAALYADAGVVKVAGAPADASGREAIAQNWQKLFDAFNDYKAVPNRIWIKNDVAIVEWAFNGTHTGDLWGMKATEKKVGAQGIDMFWFNPDGAIKEHHVYYDGGTILSQIGVSKQKARPIPTLASKPEVFVSTGAPEETKNVDTSKAMTAALEAKKEADFLAVAADTIEYDDMTQPATSKGKAEAKKFFKEMTTGFPDAKFNVDKTFAVGDFVITEGTMTGTHKGSFFGIPATKKTVNLKSVDVHQFKDGKMVKGWSYSNGAEFMQQLGLAPKPPAAKPADPKAATATPGDKKPADTKAGDKKPDAKPAEKK